MTRQRPVEWITEWEWSTLKNGRRGRALKEVRIAFCPINTCGVCGLTGGWAKVRNRDDVWGWNRTSVRWDFTTVIIESLCTGCWNRARAIQALRDHAEQINTLVNKLLREVKKHGNENRRTERDPGHSDRSRDEWNARPSEGGSDSEARWAGQPVHASRSEPTDC